MIGPIKRATGAKWWATEGVIGHTFTRKSDLEQAIRDIANTAKLGAPLGRYDQWFMVDVLRRHYQFEAKCGTGLKHLEVRLNVGIHGTTRGFWIIRTDGTEIDISWVVALSPGGRPPIKTSVSQAARQEIVEQVLAVRMAQQGGVCPICGGSLADGDTHVDHRPPLTFDELLKGWLKAERLEWEDIEVEDHGLYATFKSRRLGASWQAYHASMASLRLIHKHENLARLA